MDRRLLMVTRDQASTDRASHFFLPAKRRGI